MKALPRFRFRLFVAGDSVNAAASLANLRAFCASHLNGDCGIEVIDVFKDPGLALAERVFMTPMVVKFGPPPVVRIVGTLSNPESLVTALGLGGEPPRDPRGAKPGRGSAYPPRRTATAGSPR